VLEKQIEAKVCDYAKSKGVLAYKFTSPARAAVPDRLFIGPDGRMWFCEFKREGAKPTPQQEREHADDLQEDYSGQHITGPDHDTRDEEGR
jgi:hypothetical protein